MPQDRRTGAAGNDFGRECGPKIASAIGARILSKRSNECVFNERPATIKCARLRNDKIGVYLHVLARIESVIGAFEDQRGEYSVFVLSATQFRANMSAKYRAQGALGIVGRSAFEHLGQTIATRLSIPTE